MNIRPYIIKNFLAAAAVVVVGWYFAPILVYFAAAMLVSVLGAPLVAALRRVKVRRARIPYPLAALAVLLVIWGVALGVVSLVIPLTIKELSYVSQIDVRQVLDQFREPLAVAQDLYNQYMAHTGQSVSLVELLAGKIASLLDIKSFVGILAQLSSLLGNALVAAFSITFISFFLLKEPTLLRRILLWLMPQGKVFSNARALRTIRVLMSRYLIGILLQSTAIFTLVTLGLAVVGVELRHTLLVGVVAGIINVIPYIGPLIGSVFGVIVCGLVTLGATASATLPTMLLAAVVFAVVHLIDNFVFQPLIFSTSVKAHPLEIFFVILVAGYLAGVAGMIVGVPVYTVLRVVAKVFVGHNRLVESLTRQI